MMIAMPLGTPDQFRYYYESVYASAWSMHGDGGRYDDYDTARREWRDAVAEVSGLHVGPSGELGKTMLLVLYDANTSTPIAIYGRTSSATPSEIRDMVAKGAPGEPPSTWPPPVAYHSNRKTLTLVIGGLVLAGAIGTGIYFFTRRKRRR